MSEANKEQNNNNNDNDNQKENKQDDKSEEQLEQEIQDTYKRLQYLYARKWDLACKKEREMQEKNGNQQSSESQNQNCPQWWQYYNPEHHDHHDHRHHGPKHFPPWMQWGPPCNQECKNPNEQGTNEKCNQPPPFFFPWFHMNHPGCHGPRDKKHEHMKNDGKRGGPRGKMNGHCPPPDWWQYWYGYQGYEVPQQKEEKKEDNNNNNANDNA